MKRDIRDLFQKEEETGRTLPKAHRQEFYHKLKASRSQRRTRMNQGYIVRIAAIVILLFALTFVLVKSTEKVSQTIVEESSIESQVEAIEQEYLASIDQEWNNFINLADDDRLVGRYKRRLDELDEQYREITLEFKSDPNDIIVLEALVENLKTRLKLLKDIQEHIKLINQTNEQYENNF